jgi:hypothetical protein
VNIFFLSDCPDQSAKWLVDRHVLKQGLESVQLLCTAYHEQGIKAPYKSSHRNHPSSIWCRSSYDNFQWLIAHAYGIFDEYTARYGNIHKSQSVLEWCEDNVYKMSFDSYNLTSFAIAISEDCECRKLSNFESLSAVEKYRSYYRLDKKHLHQWKRNRPEWLDHKN